MSTENLNTDATTQADNKGEQKTFTQEQVNAIISDRLARDRQKQSEEMSKKEQELAQREFRLNSRQKLIDRGYSESLMDALNCSSEEAFNKALDIIDSLIKERTPVKEEPKITITPRITGGVVNGNNVQRTEPDSIRKAMNL